MSDLSNASPAIPGEFPKPRRPSMEAGIQGAGKLTFRASQWHGSRDQVAGRRFRRERVGNHWEKGFLMQQRRRRRTSFYQGNSKKFATYLT